MVMLQGGSRQERLYARETPGCAGGGVEEGETVEWFVFECSTNIYDRRNLIDCNLEN